MASIRWLNDQSKDNGRKRNALTRTRLSLSTSLSSTLGHARAYSPSTANIELGGSFEKKERQKSRFY